MAAKLQAAGVDTTTYAAEGMPHDAAMFAGLVAGTDCYPKSDYSAFGPTLIWAHALRWLASLPGWEDTTVPAGW